MTFHGTFAYTFAVMQLSGLDNFAAQDLSRIGLDGWRLTARRWNSVRRWAPRWAQRRTPIYFGKVKGWVTLGLDWIIPQAVEVDYWLMVKDGLTVLSQPGVFENSIWQHPHTCVTHALRMRWSTFWGCPMCQSRTNTTNTILLQGSHLVAICRAHRKHRKPQPEIGKKKAV